MNKIKTLGVFCGAASGQNPQYIKDAEKLGNILAKNGIKLIYGAGHVGMMGAVAKGCLDENGLVKGVINTMLQEKETQTLPLSELEILPSLHIRKDALFEASDAFCVLPGGIGTLDEVFEVMTLKQLEEHKKPIIMYNVNGFWNSFKAILDHLVEQGFVRPEHAKLVTYIDKIEDVLPVIEKELS